MRVYNILCIIVSTLAVMLVSVDGHALSVSAKSHYDYRFLMSHLRDVQVMIDNFATDEQKKLYNDITEDFKMASLDYYAHNFVIFDKESKKHRMKFYMVKLKLSDLLEGVAKSYLDRTTDLLKDTAKDSFSILIRFTKGGYAKYFTRPVDPVSILKQERIYKPEEYHLYHDRFTIEQYLRSGYKWLEDARRLYEDPDIEIIKGKKEKNDYDLNHMVNSYLNVIDRCRQAKQFGIEIYRIIRSNYIFAAEKKFQHYNISITSPDPVFDVRIPEKYKIDANDNIKLLHSHELKKLPEDFPKSPVIEK